MLPNDAVRKDCPTCGQPAGERCVDMDDGRLRDSYHRARVLASIPRGDERWPELTSARRPGTL